MTPRARLHLACVALSTWMALLLVGLTFGGWVHLLLVAAFAAVPWRVGRTVELPHLREGAPGDVRQDADGDAADQRQVPGEVPTEGEHGGRAEGGGER